MSEFLNVSKDLEIKNLSTGIELNDQTDSNEESNKYENNVLDDDVAQTFSDDGAYVEHRTQTVIRQNNESNKNVSRIDGAKYPCDKCNKQYAQQTHLTRHIQSVHET